jgi:uncharacterized membrane protein YccC
VRKGSLTSQGLGVRAGGHGVRIPARVQSLADRFVMSDPGWGRAQMAWRTMVSLVAGMAAGYAAATGLGQQPRLFGLTVGGLIGLITGLQVPNAPARAVSSDIGWFIPPFAAGLLLSVGLAPHRAAGEALLVVLLFLFAYLDRFGHRGHYFGTMLFASYLAGLLAPIPLSTYPRFLVMAVAVGAACSLARAALCRHSPARDLRQTLLSFQAASRSAAASLVGVLEGRGGADRAARRLRRDMDRVNTIALVFDGRLAHQSFDERLAEHLHRSVFDIEHALVSLTELCQALTDGPVPAACSAAAAQMAALAVGRPGDSTALRASAAEIRRSGLAAHERPAELLEQAADELDAYRLTTGIFTAEISLAADEQTPFQGVIALEGGRPAGVRPLARKAATAAPAIWWWRLRRPAPGTAKAIQAAIGTAIAIPVGAAFDSQHYYWAVIGVLIMGAVVSTPHERGRKLLRRMVGTVVGAVLGIALQRLIGQGHPWWTLTVIVLALSTGAYGITVYYPVFVAGLVVALVQVYGLSTSGTHLDTLLVHRLAENAIGCGIAVIVALVVLPISTRAVIRAGLHSSLQALNAFALTLRTYLVDPDPGIRLRSGSRALDHTLFQTRQVAAHLVRVPARLRGSGAPKPTAGRNHDLLSRLGERHRRLDEVIDGLSTAARQVRTIARHAPHGRSRTSSASKSITQIVDTLTTSIAALDNRLDGSQHQEWTSCSPLIRQLLSELPDEDTDLAPTLTALDELDTCLTQIAADLGLVIIDSPPRAASVRASEHSDLNKTH